MRCKIFATLPVLQLLGMVKKLPPITAKVQLLKYVSYKETQVSAYAFFGIDIALE
jgi:hypothetical protein